ncbi:sporulation protein YunB [Thalassobacillus hwangdonensis]|uniref:Sporulation protein YunB n=1 Tax=Thalassobacillus hwangdonensis TaxID=546108 RepID=A0ABW3L3A8_9BACI
MNRFSNNYRTPPSMGKIFVITFIFFIFFTFLSLWVINKGITPTLIEIAETKTQQYGRDALLDAVSKRIADDLTFEDMITMEKNDEGYITYMAWNSVVVNRVLRNTTYRVQNFLRHMERGEIPDGGTTLDVPMEEDEGEEGQNRVKDDALIEIPIGQATNNAVLANLGPKVPVKFTVIGDVQSNVDMRVTEYGINSALFEVLIHIEVNVRLVIPFSTKTTVVYTDIPVAMNTLSGPVPEFYNGMNGENAPSFSIPMNIDPDVGGMSGLQ